MKNMHKNIYTLKWTVPKNTNMSHNKNTEKETDTHTPLKLQMPDLQNAWNEQKNGLGANHLYLRVPIKQLFS